MKKIKTLIGLLFTLPVLLSAQPLDCSSFLSTLTPEEPYEINPMSKSASCVSGKKYELVIPLQSDYEYRFVFYASSAFNNDINFKMLNLNSNDVIFDVPGHLGEYAEVKKGMTALQPYWDQEQNKSMHPYFIIRPTSDMNVKLILDVLAKDDLIQGCITVVILDRKIANGSF